MTKKKKVVDLTIRNLSVRQPQIIIHKHLPAVPFSIMSIAMSESGKTNVNMNLILNYDKVFKDNVYIIQKTPCLTVKKNLIDNKRINAVRFHSFYDKYGNSILEAIFKQQQELYENDEEMPHILIYIDDMYHPIMNEPFGIFTDIYTAGRHYNISIIQVSHRWRKLSTPHNRSLCKYFILFRTTDDEELDAIATEKCG